jgi:hypothetical protein
MTRTTITWTNTEGEIPRIETLTHVTPHQPTWRDRACEITTDEDAPLGLRLAAIGYTEGRVRLTGKEGVLRYEARNGCFLMSRAYLKREEFRQAIVGANNWALTFDAGILEVGDSDSIAGRCTVHRRPSK